jgi:ligand-binding SRPBCC domain-containing protein
MARLRLETWIAAPAERVFDLARDLDLHQRSLAHTHEEAVAGKTSGLIELGDEVEWRARHLGFVWRLRSRVTVMDRPKHFADVQVTGPFDRFEHHHRFLPAGRGTLMVDEWAHTAPLGLLGRLADRLFLERYMRALPETRSRALKEAAETV